jgi:hypothetical protein
VAVNITGVDIPTFLRPAPLSGEFKKKEDGRQHYFVPTFLRPTPLSAEK